MLGGGGARRLLAVVSATVVALLAAAPAHASLLVPNLNWTALLPPLDSLTVPQPGPVPNCEEATIACIDTEIDRLQARRDALGCDHRAVFAATYLELTKQLREDLDNFGDLVFDRPYLYTEDAEFANIYFDTSAAYEQGQPVAPAWRIAFNAAKRRATTATQDMLLGINAHVQNDMPFLIASLGVRTADGRTRKPDHDAINATLNRAYERVVTAIRTRYDPLVGLSNPPIVPADDIAGLEMVRVWRELVWRNAERLLNAKSDVQRARVTRQIQLNAGAWAKAIAIPPVPGATQIRDTYCAEHVGG
jgi:hypothetical protein